ncbi:MAG: hypothetical protein ACI88L_000613 [Candidatus Paceibacteria bacterium]|jgi:hypothetical protein
MDISNIGCLHKCGNGMYLQFTAVEDLLNDEKFEKETKGLKIDIEKNRWRYITQGGYCQNKDWSEIGETNKRDNKFVQLIFNTKDKEQLIKAFSTASHFYSSNEDRGL